MKTKLTSKRFLIPGLLILVLIGLATLFIFYRRSTTTAVAPAKPTPAPPPVNLISVSERPFVALKPLAARNELALTLDSLKLPAEEVEVSLEYDRNKGVWDAVLKQFMLSKLPLSETLFLGSKSAGGHITYHEDVVGGKLTLVFRGGDSPYTLEVPWRYDDTLKEYQELSSQDGKFQAVFSKPIKTNKIIVMQSPGLPAELAGTVHAGPYLITAADPIPDNANLTLTLRLPSEDAAAVLYGWDGTAWQKIESTNEGKMLSATTPYYQAWVVVSP